MDVGAGEEGGGEDPGEERGSGVYDFRQAREKDMDMGILGELVWLFGS